MDHLKHLEGTWSGSGWSMSQDGTRSEFDQTERILLKLDGIAMVVEGIGRYKGSEEIAFNALAVFTYDLENEQYDIRSYLASGESTSATGNFVGDNFIWSIIVPGGTVRYTMKANESTWHEYGEFSSDGNQWYKFMEMNLSKTTIK